MNSIYKYILAIDPSGNFYEGKGTTGWVLMDSTEHLISIGSISAKDYKCAEEYWDAHIEILDRYFKQFGKDLIVVMEEYILYRNRSKNQTNSKIETCRLIGVLQHFCWRYKQPYTMQLAASVKSRWSDNVLKYEKILDKKYGVLVHRQTGLNLNSDHIRDAFRHAIHYAVCRNEVKERKGRSYANFKRSNY